MSLRELSKNCFSVCYGLWVLWTQAPLVFKTVLGPCLSGGGLKSRMPDMRFKFFAPKEEAQNFEFPPNYGLTC